ncbi:MAG: acyl-[acyl-carrier-protein] thioesterase, partial [Olsenella sp.]|nr:acyl-[acyl-carrier-protein] thioesterase [Olsenella sp.]
STWCYGMKRLMANRNFTIRRTDGSSCVRADSLWFVYDTEARRPTRIPDSQMPYLTNEPPLDLEATQRKIQVEGDETDASPIVVTEHHLDTNRHVNNAQYISMAIDALDELGLHVDLHRIAVQYKTMALLGDTIVPRVHRADHGFAVDLSSVSGGTFSVVKLEGE